QQQLALDEEALRETLEEEARAEKERERAEKNGVGGRNDERISFMMVISGVEFANVMSELFRFEQFRCDNGNSQVKDNKIDLLVQQYEQFTILEEESIDSGFARFNTIITSLKALDEGFSSIRRFLRALHPKWRAKLTVIEESKDLSSLVLDELIGNLKVHEVVMEKDFEIYRGKKERVKSIALKAKKESSDDETLTSESDDEEYVMAVRNFKKFFKRKGKFVRQPREEKKSFRQRDEKKGKSDRKCFRCGDPNHLIGDCPKPSRNKDRKAFIEGSWSDSENDAEDKTNDKTCLMDQSSNEVTFNSSYYSDNASSLDNDTMQIEYDSLCEISLKIITRIKFLKTQEDLFGKKILELNDKIKKLKRSKEIDITCLLENILRNQMNGSKIGVAPTFDVKESLNVTFDESPPPTKLSPLVDDDIGEEEAIRNNPKVVNNNNEEDESIEVDKVVNIKESKNHPPDQVIGNLNQRTLRSQAQDHTNDVWDLVPLPMSQSVIGTKWVFRNKLDENGIVSRNKARLVAQGYNQQECIDYNETYAR
ncbi:zf-CCHC domain-containing protein, partial [Tanacetum coccineum]